ncbi:MAG: cytochrome c nitrite reductase small subunit [Verrucomicrobiales bacterium]
MALAVLLGLLAGMGFFTFGYANGSSYLKNDPLACVNCHVMQDYYDSWLKSSHHDVAVCNDCHLSHHPVGKWVTKADNGFFHALAFTLGNYRDPIQIKPRNRKVTQNGCLHCHEEVVHPMISGHSEAELPTCVTCHADVGHAGNRSRSTPQPWITRD